jgi:RNA polymerase sigma factor (sigma-70 family)
MAIARGAAELRHARTLLTVGAVGALSDGQLLERFLARRDEAAELAFAVLIERHGPMVFRVCRGILRNPHDAEDAFQATFLVLLRRAASIRKRDSLGSWLHGVACRVASFTRSASARRREHEERRGMLTAESLVEPEHQLDLAPFLHREIERLPASCRAAIVACHLEGLTHEQAAARLGWPVGTVCSRLARGRERLRLRLIQRGVAPSAALLGLAVSQGTASAAVPMSLVRATARAACAGVTRYALAPAIVTLTRRAFSMVSIKAATAAVILTLTALGAAQVRSSTPGRAGEALEAQDPEPQAAAPMPPAIELEGRTEYDPDTMFQVRPRFSAIVEKTLVRLGHTVKKGDPLFELRSTDLAAAKSDFQTKFIRWQHDRKLYELREKLFQTGAISQPLWDETQRNEQGSRLDYNLARDRLQVYEVSREEIDRIEAKLHDRKNLARFTLVARADGVAVESSAFAGNFYEEKDVLMVLAPLDHLWVVVSLPERLRGRIKVGQGVEVESPLRQQTFPSVVEFVGPVTEGPHAFAIRTTIPNPDGRLRAKMTVRLRIMESLSDPDAT